MSDGTELETVFTGEYFVITNTPGGNENRSVENAILTDDDLIRGNAPNEGIALDDRDGDDFVLIAEDAREVTVTVVFTDGTTLSGVLGQSTTTAFPEGFVTIERYALDQAALEAVGKSYADILTIENVATTDHDLSYADFGFAEETRAVFDPGNATPSGVLDRYTIDEPGAALTVSAADGVLANDMDPEGDVLTAEIQLNPQNGTLVLNPDGSFTYTPNEGFIGEDTFTYNVTDGNTVEDGFVRITVQEGATPEFNIIPGTGGSDRLVGTDGRDVIDGNAGDRDVLIGNGGEDVFVFGLNANSSGVNRDIIRDFDADEDTIALEFGTEIDSVRERNGNLIIRLEGDGDIINVRNADSSILDDILFLDGEFDPVSFFDV